MSFYSSFIKKSVFYSFLQILPALAGIIILKLYSSLLSKEEFAVLGMLTTVSMLSFIINSLYLDQVITRYYYDHLNDRQRLDDFFISVISVIFFLLLLLVSLVFLIPASINELLFKGMLHDMRWQFLAAVLVGFALSLNKSLLSFQRNEQAHAKVLVLTLLASLLQVGLVWICIRFFPNKVLGAQLGKFAGIFIPTIAMLAFYFKGKKPRIRLFLIKDIVPFFMPLVLYGLIYWGISQFDQFIFQLRMKNLELLALYLMAFNIALFADMVLSGLISFIYPELNMIMKKESDTGRIANYLHLFVLLSCFAILLISLAGEILADLFLDQKYSTIGWIIDGLLIGYIYRMLYVIFSFPVYYSKKTMIITAVLIVSLILSLSLNWILIPFIGIFALILSNFIARISQSWLTSVFAGKVFKLPFNRLKVYGLSVIFSLLLFGLMVVDYLNLFNSYLAFGLAFIIAMFTTLLLFRKQMPVLVSILKEGSEKLQPGNPS